MGAQGAHGLTWRLARHPEIPVDLLSVRAMPARLLWQSEIAADAFDRIARRERLEAANQAAHQRALRGRR